MLSGGGGGGGAGGGAGADGGDGGGDDADGGGGGGGGWCWFDKLHKYQTYRMRSFKQQHNLRIDQSQPRIQ